MTSRSRSETNISAEIQLAASRIGARLWRNQTGKYELADGRWLSSGLCVGSPDLVGIAPDGRFLAIEVKKRGGRTSEAQIKFINMVCAMGGVSGICTSVEDFLALFR